MRVQAQTSRDSSVLAFPLICTKNVVKWATGAACCIGFGAAIYVKWPPDPPPPQTPSTAPTARVEAPKAEAPSVENDVRAATVPPSPKLTSVQPSMDVMLQRFLASTENSPDIEAFKYLTRAMPACRKVPAPAAKRRIERYPGRCEALR